MSLPAKEIDVCGLHLAHPIRAEDWRSPLIYRLLESVLYHDGAREVVYSYRDESRVESQVRLRLIWRDLREDFERCLRTYQGPVLTEFAALGMACVL